MSAAAPRDPVYLSFTVGNGAGNQRTLEFRRTVAPVLVRLPLPDRWSARTGALEGWIAVSRWVFVILFGLEAHFAASFLVPLDAPAQREFGGLIRWFWPWSDGDGGLLGRVTTGGETPLAALFLALLSGTALLLAALAAAGWWVPSAWLRPLAGAGAALLLVLMATFFGPTKVLPIAFALGTLYLAIWHPTLLAGAVGESS